MQKYTLIFVITNSWQENPYSFSEFSFIIPILTTWLELICANRQTMLKMYGYKDGFATYKWIFQQEEFFFCCYNIIRSASKEHQIKKIAIFADE